VCGLLAVYSLQLDAWVAAPLLMLAALSGFLLARRELRARLAPGAGAVAGFAVLALYLAPTVLTGHWSWNGYNYLNDTAVQFLLAVGSTRFLLPLAAVAVAEPLLLLTWQVDSIAGFATIVLAVQLAAALAVLVPSLRRARAPATVPASA